MDLISAGACNLHIPCEQTSPVAATRREPATLWAYNACPIEEDILLPYYVFLEPVCQDIILSLPWAAYKKSASVLACRPDNDALRNGMPVEGIPCFFSVTLLGYTFVFKMDPKSYRFYCDFFGKSACATMVGIAWGLRKTLLRITGRNTKRQFTSLRSQHHLHRLR